MLCTQSYMPWREYCETRNCNFNYRQKSMFGFTFGCSGNCNELISKWCNEYGTQHDRIITIHKEKRNRIPQFFTASTNGTAFTLRNYTKYLVLLLDGKLNWNINIQSRHNCFLLLHKTDSSCIECIQIWSQNSSIQRSRGLVIIFRKKSSSNPVWVSILCEWWQQGF